MFNSCPKMNHLIDAKKDLKKLHFQIQELILEKNFIYEKYKTIENTIEELKKERERLIKYIEEIE